MLTSTTDRLSGRTAFITGGSRGIGLAIACKLAEAGVNVAIAAKTVEPHPRLEGTIHTARAAIEAAARHGARALALQMDVRDDASVEAAIARTVEVFGGLDIVINNASAIALEDSAALPMKRFDLMHQINTRGTYLVSRTALPHLEASGHAHILMLAPPLNLSPRWSAPHLGYSLAKYGMSLCVLGLAEELRGRGIGVNALWPRTYIATAAVANVVGDAESLKGSRSPEIMADAAREILSRDPRAESGNFHIDDDVLSQAGLRDFSRYRLDAKAPLHLDMFLDPDMPLPPGSDLAGSDPAGRRDARRA